MVPHNLARAGDSITVSPSPPSGNRDLFPKGSNSGLQYTWARQSAGKGSVRQRTKSRGTKEKDSKNRQKIGHEKWIFLQQGVKRKGK